MTKRIAIIGGGIAGLYTAWRLLMENKSALECKGSPNDPPFQIHLYERETSLGGRIRSQEIFPLKFRAELGAMRFRRSHLLLNALLKQLEIPTRPFNLPSPVFYVRGRRLSTSEITKGKCSCCNAAGPFHLSPGEQGMSAVELIRFAIRKLLQVLNFPGLHQGKARQLKRKIREEDFDDETWYYIKEEGLYQGLRLYQIGFWNFLQHFLSNEAYVMVNDVLSLESILGNWNTAEAIPWFLADFSTDQYDMVPGGLSQVAQRLEQRIRNVTVESSPVEPAIASEAKDIRAGTACLTECLRASIEIRLDQTVRAIEFKGQSWTVKSTTYLLDGEKYQRDEKNNRIEAPGYEEKYDSVILALPSAALKNMKIRHDTVKDSWPPRWLGWVQGHRMFKIFLLYAEPWWMGDEFPGYDTGRVFTDLPLRQVYHFSPTWIRSHGEMQKLDGGLTVSDRDQEEPDEGGFAVVMASYSDDHHVSFWEPMLKAKEDLNLLAPADQPYIQPSPKLDDKVWGDLWAKIKEVIEKHPELLAKRRMVEKAHLLLQEIHGREIPHPILGIAQDWDAGWHTWIAGSKPWEESTRHERVQPLDALYLCGEAYSPEQGWIEGAIKSSEQVLERMMVSRPAWLAGLHPNLGSYIDPYKWLDLEKEKGKKNRRVVVKSHRGDGNEGHSANDH